MGRCKESRIQNKIFSHLSPSWVSFGVKRVRAGYQQTCFLVSILFRYYHVNLP